MPRGSADRSGRHACIAAALVLVLVAVGACSRDGFEDRTAVVTIDDDTLRFALDSCGLDGSTLFVVGRSDAGEILQAVVGMEDDEATGQPAATGFTFEVDSLTYGAFGATAWERRNGRGEPPGEISRATMRGARIQLAGSAELVGDGRVTGDPSSSLVVALDARCDERG